MKEQDIKEKIIRLLEEEKWYPAVHVTNEEWQLSKMLNKILDNLIEEIHKIK